MCARYTLTGPVQPFGELFDLDLLLDLAPRFNVAPTQPVPVIRTSDEGRPEFARLGWGLIPSWGRDPAVAAKHVNARGETVEERPTFREPFRRRRCLILADGFFEWESTGAGKQPYFIHRPGRAPFAFAGIWDRWHDRETCAILTTTANDDLRHLHERMPVILTPDNAPRWLADQGRVTPDLRALLAPLAPGELEMYAVSPKVNKAAYDRPENVEPYRVPVGTRQATLWD